MSNTVKKSALKSSTAPAKAKKPAAKTKNTPVINMPTLRNTKAFDQVKQLALTQFIIGRDATYNAIALTYIWYELAATLPSYRKKAFDGLADQSNSHNFAKALKVCLKLTTEHNASTISKYKQVLLYIDHELQNHTIKTGDDTTIKMVTDVIVKAKGIDGCATKLNAIGSGNTSSKGKTKKPLLTPQQVEGRLKRYKSKAASVQTSFAPPKQFKAPKSKLVVMIGRIANDDSLEVVDVIANDKLVHHVARHK